MPQHQTMISICKKIIHHATFSGMEKTFTQAPPNSVCNLY